VSVTCLYTPYKRDFEPLVRIEENVAIPKGKGAFEYFKVLFVEPVQPITVAVSLPALERNKEYTLKEIELEDNEAGQWRLWIPDFVAVKMNYPRASSKWTTKTSTPSALPLSMAHENVLEFFTWKNHVPILYLDNPVDEEQTARLLIWGFKYSLEKIEEKPKEYTVLPVFSAEFVAGTKR